MRHTWSSSGAFIRGYSASRCFLLGSAYRMHQGIATRGVLNSQLLKNKVVFSALEADICPQRLTVLLQQRARISVVEGDAVERALNPGASWLTWMEIALQVGREVCLSGGRLVVLQHPGDWVQKERSQPGGSLGCCQSAPTSTPKQPRFGRGLLQVLRGRWIPASRAAGCLSLCS